MGKANAERFATMRLMLTGETIQAAEALRIGLAHQVLSSQRFLPDAEELLTMLATPNMSE